MNLPITELVATVSTTQVIINDESHLCSRQRSIVSHLLDNASQVWRDFLRDNSQRSSLEELACNMLYDFYAPKFELDPLHKPDFITMFEHNSLSFVQDKRQKIIGHEILGFLPAGTNYEIIAKPNCLHILFKFEYLTYPGSEQLSQLHILVEFVL